MNKVSLSYKQQSPQGPYDVIIIGSGIGALTTAALLSRQGKKVLILERHYTPGGFTHMFTRKDFEWDVGIHYIGEVMNPYSFMRMIFDYMSDGELEWEDMGRVYDRIAFGDKIYDLVAGKQEFKEQLKEYFPAPKDQQAIDEYVELVYVAAKSVRSFFAERALPAVASFFAGRIMKSKFLKFSEKTTYETLRELTDNEELIAVLTGQYGDYGLTPKQSSFMIHAMVVKHYFRGGAYPVGGSSRIIETFAPGIQKTGGDIFSNAEVTEILVKDNKAVGVKMLDGKELYAETIISGAGFSNTVEKLLPEAVTSKFGYKAKAKQVKPSASHVSLYIGLDKTAEELNLPKANYWIYPDRYDHDQNLQDYIDDQSNPLPLVYVSFPSAKDPDFEKRFPGRATIEIITFAPFEHFAKWDGTRWKKRGEEYEAYKEHLSQRMLEQLYRFEPQVKEHIVHYELSTPLSTKHFANYQKGEVYGLEHTPDRFTKKFLKPRTPVKNLYLTGQDVVTAGVGGALFAGVLTASAVLNRNLVSDILKKVKE